MIKAIIFDFGSVLYKPDWEKSVKGFEKEEGFNILFNGNKELEAIYDKINTGKEEFKSLLIKLAPHRRDFDKIIGSYKKYYTRNRVKNDKLYKLIRKLKKNYTLYCYTDTIKEHREANEKLGLYKDFKNVFTSYELGVRKKHPDAFSKLLKQIPFKADECILVDDHQENIENARKEGFHVIHYTEFPDIKPIEEGLKNLGVKVKNERKILV